MTANPTIRSIVAFLIFTIAAFGAAAIGALVTDTGLTEWYPTLNKPMINPPNWVFPIVWTILFALMAVAAWLVWRRKEEMPELVRPALLLFFVQLIANVCWSVAFFGLRSPLAGLIVIVPFLVLIVEMARRYRPVSSAAYSMTIPYICWVSFAMMLNFMIWWLNSTPEGALAG